MFLKWAYPLLRYLPKTDFHAPSWRRSCGSPLALVDPTRFWCISIFTGYLFITIFITINIIKKYYFWVSQKVLPPIGFLLSEKMKPGSYNLVSKGSHLCLPEYTSHRLAQPVPNVASKTPSRSPPSATLLSGFLFSGLKSSSVGNSLPRS